MLRQSSIWLMRLGAALAVVLTVLVLMVLLAGRFWLGDRLDSLRPRIVARLSQEVGAAVSIDGLEMRWQGLLPRILLHGLRVRDGTGRVDLSLERVSARPGLLGLLQGRVEFVELLITQPDLEIMRRADGRLLLAGVLLPGPTDEPGSPFVDWLLNQREIRIVDGRLHWRDLQAGTRPLDLPGVQLRLHGNGHHHLLDLSVAGPANLLRGFEAHVDMHAIDSRHFASWHGSLKARADFIDIDALRVHLDTPAALRSGRGGFSTELQFTGRQLDALESDTRLESVGVTLAADLPELRFDRLSGHVGYRSRPGGFALAARQLLALTPGTPEGSAPRPADVDVEITSQGGHASASEVNLGALAGLTESLPLPLTLRDAVRNRAPEGIVKGLAATWTGPVNAPVTYRVQSQVTDLSLRAVAGQPGVQHLSGTVQADTRGGSLALDSASLMVDLPQLFGQPLRLAAVAAAAHWQQRGSVGTTVTLDRLRLDDPDLAGSVTGSLDLRDGRARQASLSGLFEHVELAAVPRFLPLVVGGDARRWLQAALHGGTARQVTLQLAGDLQRFPFEQAGSGVFRVHVPVDNLRLDYAPGWPAITALRGVADFDGAGLRVQIGDGHQEALQLHDVQGGIASLLADKPLLELHGAVTGPLQSALQFILDSPLRATLGTFAGSVRAVGEGSLALVLQVPLANPDATRVNGTLTLERGELLDPAGNVPPLTHLATRLQFTERDVHADVITARVLGGTAQATLRTQKNGDVQLEAQGQADLTDLGDFYGDGKLGFLRGRGDWNGVFRFAAAGTEIDVHGRLPLLGYPADLQVLRKAQGLLTVQASGHAPMAGVLRSVAPALAAHASGELDWTFLLRRDHGLDDISGGGQFALLGHAGRFVLGGRPGALQAELSGEADMRALAPVLPATAAGILAGSTGWTARYDERSGQPLVRLQSDLRGLQVNLPAPFGKAAAQAQAMRLQVQRLRGGNLLLQGTLENQLALAALLPAEPGEPVRRVGLRVGSGGGVSVPASDGIEITGTLASIDLEAWQAALRVAAARAPLLGGQPSAALPGMPVARKAADAAGPADAARPEDAVAPTASPAASTAALPALPALPVRADLRLGQLLVAGYRLEGLQLVLRSADAGWHLEAHGPAVDGSGDWQPAGGGRVTAQLARLYAQGQADAPADARGPPGLSRARLPELDVAVDDLRVDGHALGRLELRGAPAAEGWHLARLALTHAEGTLTGEGDWFNLPGHSSSHVKLELKAQDTGALLRALGYPQALARARTTLRAALDWPGDPQDFEVGRLSGTLELDARNGQFLTLEPGVGRLLGLISLQALPRRVTLDFRDIFSQGFAFDAVTGHLDLEQGILRTQNLEMDGPAARVYLKGHTALSAETQDLSVRVSPAVGNGVAVASTVLGGPVAGAAAYALQKLLRDPLDKILTFEYHVTGTWDDPQVLPLRTDPAGPDKPGAAPAGALNRSRSRREALANAGGR